MTEYALIWAAVSSKPQDRYSIDDQLRMARDWCQRSGAVIVDELVVRGFSRDYFTLADVVEASAHEPDMTAFARLQDHIRRKTFTVFVTLDADRFGRTPSLVHEVIGRVTRAVGADIVTLFDGVRMDAENANMIGALKAFKARSDIDRLVQYKKVGQDNRAQSGKAAQGRTPLFQRIVRDDSGKEVEVVINEDLRPLWTALAAVILAGVPWARVEQVLFDEYGYGVHGKPYRRHYMRHLVLHPAFWGHAAVNIRFQGGSAKSSSGAWMWDDNEPPPPGVTIYRGRFPAVYSGEWAALGEQVKAELWRRLGTRGKAAHNKRLYRFTGLLVCESCGYFMHSVTDGGRRYFRCQTAVYRTIPVRSTATTCDQRRYVKATHIQQWFTERFEAKLAGRTADMFSDLDRAEQSAARIRGEEQRVDKLRRRASALVVELADAPDSLKATYRQKVNETAAELERAEQQLLRLRSQHAATAYASDAQADLLALLSAHGIDWFWTQPDIWINQKLAAALGVRRVVCHDGECIGTAPVPRNPHNGQWNTP